MPFLSKWITSAEFCKFEPIDVFHKEYDAPDLPVSKLKNEHIAFRSTFHAGRKKAYHIDITADDYYKLYINGVFVGQGPKASYPHYQSFNRFDLSSFIHPGQNCIAVHVYYNGDINRSYQSGDQRCGLLLDIYEENRYLFGTNENWRYRRLEEYRGTATVGYETAYLENIDFRLETKGWRDADYDDSAWLPAIVNDKDDHKLENEPCPAVSVYEIMPQQCLTIAPGHYLIDFGEEICGQFSMIVKGFPNQEVIIRHGEELISENQESQTAAPPRVRFDMRCNCRYEEILILSGETDEVCFFDYKAFRYVEVLSSIDNLDPKSFKAIRRHHPFELKQKLITKNEYLSKIWDISVNTLRCAAQETLVDCPGREKGQYLGDFTVSGLSHLYLTGDLAYYRSILRDFARSSDICPGLMAVVPGSFMQEIADFSLLFPLQVWNAYRYSKDKSFIREFFPVVEGILKHFSRYEREDGLLEAVSDKWNLVDWPANLRDNYDFDLPSRARTDGCHNVINAYYLGALGLRNKMAGLLGIHINKKSYIRRKNAFIAEFYDEKAKLFKDTVLSAHHW